MGQGMNIDYNNMKEYKKILEQFKQDTLEKQNRQKKIKQFKLLLYPFIIGMCVGIFLCMAL